MMPPLAFTEAGWGWRSRGLERARGGGWPESRSFFAQTTAEGEGSAGEFVEDLEVCWQNALPAVTLRESLHPAASSIQLVTPRQNNFKT
jgi:hypothetical protein